MKRVFELWKRTFLFLCRTQKRQLESTTFIESLSSAVKINNRYTSIKLSTRWATTPRVIEFKTTCFDLILLIRKSNLQIIFLRHRFFLRKYCLNPWHRLGLRHDPRFWHISMLTNLLFLKKPWCYVGGRVKHENSVLSNELRKVELPPWKIWKANFLTVNPAYSLRQRANARNVSFPNLSRWQFDLYQLVW